MASHDIGWDTFRVELRRWMELRRMTNRQLAERLSEMLRDEDQMVDEYVVKRWRHSTSPPLRALRHIAEILGMSDDPTGAGEHDPSYLLRRMGLIDEGASTDELFDTAYRLQELRLRLMDVRSQLSEQSARTGAGQLVQLAMSHGYAAAVYPVWDGPAGYPMHVADRLDFRPLRPDDPPVAEHPAMRAALTSHFAVRGGRRPRFSESEQDLAGQCHWAIPLIGRPFTRVGQAVHPRVAAVAVSSTTASAWPDDVGAILAWLLGYAFVSTREIVRELSTDPLAAESLRNDVHSQFLTQPPRRHVWAHHAVSLDPMSDLSPWAAPDGSVDPQLVHIRLVEDDETLESTGEWMARTLGREESEIVEEAKQGRTASLERLDSARLSDVRDRVITLDVHAYDKSAQRWEQVMQCVLQACAALEFIGRIPDLTTIHERFLRDEPEIAPAILRWLADHACPLVHPKFATSAA